MIRSSGTLASAGSLSFASVDIPSDIDLSRKIDPANKPKVRLNYASETFLLSLKPDGKPERKTWNAQAAFSTTSNGLFRLKAVKLPDFTQKDDFDSEYRKDSVFDHLKSQLKVGPLVGSGGDPADATAAANPAAGATRRPSQGEVVEKPQKRSEKYFNLLMKNYDKRVDKWTHEEEEECRDKAESAAQYFNRRAKHDATRKPATVVAARRGDSSSDEEEGETQEAVEQPPEDCRLQAWDGQMQVDVEIVILAAPGLEDDDDDKDPAEAGTPSSSGGFSEVHASRKSSKARSGKGSKGSQSGSASSGSHASPRADLYDELEQLKEEMGVDEDKKSEGSDDMPGGLKLKRLQNVWDNPQPRWSLGIGGTVFFVPDAERYAMGSSLPPPPPPSLHGRRRIHLKPRLPLEISNHRYRDEHPNIWPDAPYSPELQDYLRFEKTLMTLDLYKSCDMALTQLPQLEKASDEKKHRAKFGEMVERETQKSVAWKNWRHREKLKKKEAEKKAKEAKEAAAARALQAARAAADVAAAAAVSAM